MLITVTSEEAFAAVSHAFPKVADFQGPHFRYATKNDGVILEIKKNTFEKKGDCPHCGQQIALREPRFFYWLLIDGRFEMIHTSSKSRIGSMKTIGETIPS